MKKNKLVIGREAFDKIQYYVNKTNFEISGFGNVDIIDGQPTVTDIILLKQENSAAETDIDADAIAKAMFDHYESGMQGELKFWWHSHVDMDVFWSGTDKSTIKQLTENGWWYHGVFNKKNKHKIAYSHNPEIEGFGQVEIFEDDLDLVIDESIVINPELIESQAQIMALYEQIDKLNELVMPLEEKFTGTIESICKPLYDSLVTEKTYTFKKNYVGANKNKGGKMGKLSGSLTEIGTDGKTTNIHQSSMTQTIGYPQFDTRFKNCWDKDGAAELFGAGYSIAEIEYMQDYLMVYCFEDLVEYETELCVDVSAILSRELPL